MSYPSSNKPNTKYQVKESHVHITSYTPQVTVLSNPVTPKTIPDSAAVQPYLILLEHQMSPKDYIFQGTGSVYIWDTVYGK